MNCIPTPPTLRTPWRRGFGTLVVAGLALLVSASAGAQRAPRTATYIYLVGTDTIGTEALTLSDTAIAGVLAMRGAPRIDWHHARQGMTLGALSVRAYAPGSAPGSAPVQEATIRIDGDSARADVAGGGQRASQVLPAKRGAIVLVNASVVHAALIGVGASRMARTSVDLMMASGAQHVTAAVATRGDTIVLTLAGAETFIVTDSAGLPREILMPSRNARIVRATSAVSQLATTPAMSYDAPAGAPYTTQHVRIPTGRGYELAGTYTRPTLGRTVAVVVTISGSGLQERDSRLSIVPGYAIFRDIADTIARRGIATLRYDDRGIGESGGLESARNATSADFADDVRSVVAWLKARPDVNGARIALVGHSEGGMIAPMVAAADPGVRAIALLAGTAYTGRQVMMFQNRDAIDAALITPAQRDSIWASVPSRLDTLATTNKWMGFFMTHDPIATARRVKQPVLILQGDTDHQVTPEQADSLAAAFRAGGNRTVTMKRFPATNHLFLTDPSGLFSGYSKLTDTRIRRDVLGTLADWLVTTLR